MTITRHLIEGLGVTEISPVGNRSAAGRTLIATLGAFAVAGDELDRYRGIAAARDGRVLLVETPGWHPDHPPLTARARSCLLTGSFSGVAAQQWRSLERLLDPDEPVSLVGYSLGSSLAAALAIGLTGIGRRPAHLCLVEPVAVAPVDPITLLLRNRWEAVHGESSGSQRRKGWPTPVGRHQPDMALLVWALTRAGLTRDLPVLARAEVPIALLRGGSSRLCPASAFADLVAGLAASGAPVRARVHPGHNHSLWQSGVELQGLIGLLG